ncbi:MAG: DUF3501 family protein [Burkholderiales bacterium]|nr:DUF3501 family protein [Burkholderiales bacterium]
MTLEAYAGARAQYRSKVLAHKKHRTVPIGPNVTLVFEDELTMRYQVQEMLRVERIFEADSIQDELDAYNPLVPDGANWKATMLIEYPEVEERRRMLAKLIGIEDRVWARVEGSITVYAIADEDMERENTQKTSAVHFLRFDLTEGMIARLRSGGALSLGIDHPNYSYTIAELGDSVRASLLADLT